MSRCERRSRRSPSNCGYQYRQRHLQTVASLGEEAELAKERRNRRKATTGLRKLLGDGDLLEAAFQFFRVVVIALWLAAFAYGLFQACSSSFGRRQQRSQQEQTERPRMDEYYYYR